MENIFRNESRDQSDFLSFCKKARFTFGVHFKKNGRPKGHLAPSKKPSVFSWEVDNYIFLKINNDISIQLLFYINTYNSTYLN